MPSSSTTSWRATRCSAGSSSPSWEGRQRATWSSLRSARPRLAKALLYYISSLSVYVKFKDDSSSWATKSGCRRRDIQSAQIANGDQAKIISRCVYWFVHVVQELVNGPIQLICISNLLVRSHRVVNLIGNKFTVTLRCWPCWPRAPRETRWSRWSRASPFQVEDFFFISEHPSHPRNVKTFTLNIFRNHVLLV